jgi:hypothetical protein
MLQIDEDLAHRQLKDIEQLELVFTEIPTKSLYKLQMSVAQEVQSRARTNATNLETTREAKEVLETILTEVQLEREEEKHVVRIDWRKYLKKSSRQFERAH